MKLSLVGSFNLADGYLGAAKALERNGWEVSFVPAHWYRNDYGSAHINKIIEDLKEQKPDVVLWWRGETLTADQFRQAREEIDFAKFILYSWDDPYQWEMHQELPEKCEFLDMAFTCCHSSIEEYKKNGCDAFYCPPGFDPEVHYPEESEEHKCDISIVCTNLYHGSLLTRYPHLSRKFLLDSIIRSIPGIDLKIYGFENFKEAYPNHYAGWIPFNESRKVFHNSKINISTHIRPDGYMYINERVTQILGSGGLLMVDYVNGIDKVLWGDDVSKKSAIIIDPMGFSNQIKDILGNYEKFEEIKKNGYEKAMNCFTWDNWAKIIIDKIK